MIVKFPNLIQDDNKDDVPDLVYYKWDKLCGPTKKLTLSLPMKLSPTQNAIRIFMLKWVKEMDEIYNVYRDIRLIKEENKYNSLENDIDDIYDKLRRMNELCIEVHENVIKLMTDAGILGMYPDEVSKE